MRFETSSAPAPASLCNSGRVPNSGPFSVTGHEGLSLTPWAILEIH